MSDCGCEFEASNQAERRVLIALMAINGVMFVAEFGLGWLSQSTGLIADSLDMLADASVYAISLYAVGDPQSEWMIGVALVALAANVVCLWLLRKHRDGEVHMRAAWIFSANDVIANMGVIIAGVLVMVSASRWPDLVIGLTVAGIVLRGGIRILRESKQQPVTQGANTAGEV